MLGGGKFTTQNKVLNGTYINVVSAARASATLSERGIATMPIEMDWGKADEVFKVTSETLVMDSAKLFGYEYTHEKLKGIRDLFANIKECYFYRLNGKGAKASNDFAEALYAGTRGNDLKVVIKNNVDESTKFDVSTYLGTSMVDIQTVAKADELVANDWLTFKASAELSETASTPLAGGTNGEAVTAEEYQAYLNAIESYSFNAMGIPVADSAISKLAIAFTKRMRDEVGAVFQTVVFQQHDADYEGIVSVENEVLDDANKAAAVYYTTGLIAGCEINKSNTNKKYNGEYAIDTKYTQSELAEGIEKGKFMYHKVADEVRVLDDINTFVSFTDEKNSDFSYNQTIRVVDQSANDVAVLFNDKYLGKVPNNESGRMSLWNDIVKLHEEYERLQAIEGFSGDDVTINMGNDKRSVVATIAYQSVNAMQKLYVTVYVG